MKLCRTVTLAHDRMISYAVCPLARLEANADCILAGPIKLSFDTFRLAALVEHPDMLSPDFLMSDEVKVSWSVLIVEQMDKKPLFSSMSGSRALLLVTEIITNLFEGFDHLGLQLQSVAPNIITQHLNFSFVIEKGTSSRAALGSALCLATMIDGLLFVRGLTIASSMVAIVDEHRLGRLEFSNFYRFALTSIHNHHV
jgi:hypothetical protein